MVILDDEEPALVKQMVNYFYTLDYEAEQSERRYRMTGTNVTANTICYKESLAGEEQRTTETTSERSPEMWRPLSFHVLMYSLADRMFIEGLKTLARSKVQKTLFSIFQPLNAHSVQTAIMEIYSSTPITDRGLRDLAVSFAMKNMKELRKGGEQKPGAENAGRRALPNTLLESIPQFAYDLLVATLDKLDGSETLGKSMSGFGFAGATISGGNGSAGRSNFAGGARIAPR